MDFINNNFSSKVQIVFEKLIGGDNPIEQIQAAYELGDLSDEEDALDALLMGLLVPDSDVKMTVLDILIHPEFFGEQIVQPVTDLFNDEDEDIRKKAAEVLGMTKDTSAIPSLIKSLEDSSPEVRFCSMASLANIGDLDSAVSLHKILDSDNWRDRYHVIDAIGMIANPKSSEAFLKAFEDKNAKVRENAALSAGFYDKDPLIKAKLLRMLDDEEISVQGAVAYTLGDFKCKEAIPHLLDFLKSEYEDLILVAIEALAKIKDPNSINALIEALEYPANEISLAAKEALDVYRNILIIEPLVDAVKNDVVVKYLAHRLKKSFFKSGKKIKPERSLKKLKLPMWLEMLLNEVIIDENEKSDKEKRK